MAEIKAFTFRIRDEALWRRFEIVCDERTGGNKQLAIQQLIEDYVGIAEPRAVVEDEGLSDRQQRLLRVLVKLWKSQSEELQKLGRGIADIIAIYAPAVHVSLTEE